jgi:hypothetical protein
MKRHIVYYKEGRCHLPKVAGRVKLVLEVVPTKSATPLPFDFTLTTFFF